MFSGKQFGVLGVIFGANMILSLLTGTIAATVGPQGPEGATGPQGPQGNTGEAGPAGESGREVEFQTSDGALQWRYVGDTEWNTLDLELGGGGGSTNVTTGEFTDWIFSPLLVAPSYNYTPTVITDAATYQADRVSEGYTPITTVEEFEAISNDLGGRYVLMNDLDFGSYDTSSEPYVVSGTFTGTLDGAGKTIYNYSVDYTGYIERGGLFYELEKAVVRNLNLANFTFESTGDYIYNTGALSGYVNGDNSDKAYFQSVSAQNISYKASSYIQSVGGLLGEIDSSAILNDVSASTFVEVDSWIDSLGGTFGEYSGEEIEVIGGETNLTIDTYQNETNDQNLYEIGGLGGTISSSGSMIFANIVTELTGIASARVGGLLGNFNSSSRAILSNIDAEINLQRNGYGSTEYFGGLVGYIDDESFVLIDNSSVEGSIVGYEYIGGVIGYINYSSAVKINNVYVSLSLSGSSYIGGFVGYVYENEIRLLISNSEFDGDFVAYDLPNNDYFQNTYIGGAIGYISDSSTSVLEEKNQVWIDNTSITALFDFDVSEAQNVDYENYNFQYHGGFVGYVDYYNYVRATNSIVSLTNLYSVTNKETFENLSLSVSSISGGFGYVEEDNNIQVLGCSIEIAIDIVLDEINATLTSTNSIQFTSTEIGGLVGDLEDSNLIVVGTEVSIDGENTFGAINSPTYDLYYNVGNYGGLVGYSDGFRPILTDDLSVDVAFDFVYVPTGSAGPDQYVQINMYSIASLFGYCENGALMFNSTVTNLGIVLPSTPGETDSVDSYISFVTSTGYVGEPNPFVMFL